MAPQANASTCLPSSARTFLRRFPLLSAFVIGLAAALGSLVSAQNGAPVFRARTELVRMDLSVTDRDGRAVDDLRSDEIQITENGERRPVVLFRHIREDRDAEHGADGRAFEEVSRNNTAASGRLYVLVFDQLHIQAAHAQRARLAAERFVSRQLKRGDAVAIYALPGPGPRLNLTTDLVKARLALAAVHGQAHRPIGEMPVVDAYHLAGSGSAVGDLTSIARPPDLVADFGAGASLSTGNVTGAFNEVLREQATRVVAHAETESQIFLSQLAGVMQTLQVVDGRKAFVLFSEGFFMDNLAPRLEQVASSAARSNSIVYAIDVGTSLPAPDQVAPTMTAAEAAGRRDPLATLALETNGRLIADPGSLDRVLGAIASETSDYYLVAFEPSASDAPHGYHRVKIHTTRHGLQVRARTGYATSPQPTPTSDRQAIDVALTMPRTSTAIPIEYTTYEHSGPSADKPRIIASVVAYVPGRAHETAGDQDRADIVFVVRDALTGQAVASGTDRLAAARPRTITGATGLDPVPYCVQFDVPPGEYWMRVLVREPGGVIGTADRRFHVWPLGGAGLATSDLIVTRLDGERFDPPARATVHREDDVLAYLEIYGLVDAGSTQIEIVRAGSDEVVARAEPMLKAGGRGETIVRAHLPVSTLGDGQYAARVRIMAANRVLRTIMRNFRIVAGGVKAHTQT